MSGALGAVVGCRIKRRMDEAGITVRALARRAEISRSTFARRMQDPGTFYLPEVERVAGALGVSPSWLLGAREGSAMSTGNLHAATSANASSPGATSSPPW